MVCPFAIVTVPVVAPPITDKFAAVIVPVESVTEIVTSASSPATAERFACAAPESTRPETAPVIPSVKPTVAFVTAANAAASATAVASETVTVLAAFRATFVPDVTRAAVA